MNSIAPTLYEFQQVGVRFLVQARRAMLGDDMGLGKTAQAIIASKETKSNRILIICPNTLKGHWKTEIDKWVPGQQHISVLRGSSKKKKEVIKKYTNRYLIINIESVRRRPKANHDLIDDLLTIQWNTIIIDEAHSIKNRKSSQTKGVQELAVGTENVYLLTGTPILNRIDELWSPLHVLYPSRYPSFWPFVRRHTIVYRKKIVIYSKQRKKKIIKFIWVIDGKPILPKELRAEIAPIFLRREKEEVFPDMPCKIYQKMWLSMEGEQLRIYRDIEQTAMAQINDDTTVITAGILAQLTRCKQVTVSLGLIGGKPEGVKLDALIDILHGTDQKVLVFSQFAEAIKLVAKRLEMEGISHVVFIGKTKEKDRDGIIKQFQTDPEIQVFLTTTQAGGVGITLTAASLVVFLDKHWTPAVNEQAVDRTRPHMQTKSVQIIELLARNSVDKMIEDVLAGKVSIIEAVINRKRGYNEQTNNDL